MRGAAQSRLDQIALRGSVWPLKNRLRREGPVCVKSGLFSQVSCWGPKLTLFSYPPTSALKVKAGTTIPRSYMLSDQVLV